jgi:uncharacterized protein YciI
MPSYFAVLLRPGSRWDADKPVREQEYWDDHARFMDALFESGIIVLAGPFADRTGSMVILATDSVEQVYALFRDDPWTVRDVLSVADVKEWTIFLDGRERK